MLFRSIKIQKVFTNLHTLNWLEKLEPLRVLILGSGVLLLLGMGITGITILYKKRKGSGPLFSIRRFHRLLGYFVSFSLLFFAVSGIYHLLFMSISPPKSGMVLLEPLSLKHNNFSNTLSGLKNIPNQKLNNVSLIQGPNHQMYYRLSGAMNSEKKHHRFDGIPKEKTVTYINTTTGKQETLTDHKLAKFFAKKVLPKGAAIDKITRINRFGVFYDFRNKRLPVYRVDFNTPDKKAIFVDTASGVIADTITRTTRWVRFSFSFFHKWNFLRGPLGRTGRDIVMIVFLFGGILLTIAGFILMIRRIQLSKRNDR